MNSTKSTISKPGIEGRPAHMGEKIALWAIVVIVAYLFITS
jgi:hypothetical protein